MIDLINFNQNEGFLMKIKLMSMIICIGIVGITLISAGIQYINYQSNLETIDSKWEELDRQSEINNLDWYDVKSDYDDLLVDKGRIEKKFKNNLIIHGIIVGFFILSELGLLLVLPKSNRGENS